jgi:hypothetical protein
VFTVRDPGTGDWPAIARLAEIAVSGVAEAPAQSYEYGDVELVTLRKQL